MVVLHGGEGIRIQGRVQTLTFGRHAPPASVRLEAGGLARRHRLRMFQRAAVGKILGAAKQTRSRRSLPRYGRPPAAKIDGGGPLAS